MTVECQPIIGVDLGIFGRVVAWIYVIEFQKRGLPHIHAIFTLAKEDKWRKAEDVDRFVRAYMDEKDDAELRNLISEMMLHGPCGSDDPRCPCMVIGKSGKPECSKHFPKLFSEQTVILKDGTCNLRRPK